MLKKTKIICTQGPATDKPGVVEAMIENGMNCARFNFSHGSHEEHLRRIKRVREAAKKPIALILDTKGPEMRLGEFRDGCVILEKGQEFTLTHDDVPGDKTHVRINHKGLYTEVKPGDRLLLSDGLVELSVKAVQGKDILTIVQNDGKMSNRKRVAAPGITLGLPPISGQDEKDIIFGIENDMDFVAASFIQRASDVEAIRALIREYGGHMEIIPKIENLAGVRNFDDILAVSDGIMVARGDLGVEVPAEDVPLIQKELIAKCNEAGKPVIVATQMLESMTMNPRPTRAEVSDVSNAILDGTDAIMLSGETASGNYPVEAVATMKRIAQRMENSLHYRQILLTQGFHHQESKTKVIAHAAVQMAYELDASAIITPTKSGYTASLVSQYRPKASIIAFVPNKQIARHLSLRWGVYAIHGENWDSIPEMVEKSTKSAQAYGFVKKGDLTIINSGIKSVKGSTSSIIVYTI